MLPSFPASFVLTLVLLFRMNDTARSRRFQSCLARCEFEISNTHELRVYAEDILSFQRFFDPRLLGDSQREVTSMQVWCSQALLGETVMPFQPAWATLSPRLLRLRIQGCRIMALAPRAFKNFQSLTSLTIDNRDEGSPFMASKDGLQGLRNLASFRLTRVRLRSIDGSLFHPDARHNLMKVYLSRNALVRVDKHTLCGMPRLSDLDLSFNKLVGNKIDFLRCVHSLYLLNVSYNAIETLESDVFAQNKMLHTLDLSHNKMQVVSTVVRLINTTKALRKVYLAGNPWKCNVTSLFQLHYLAAGSSLQIVDWKDLRCVRDGEWLLVHDVIFPYAFGRLLQAWPVLLVVALVLTCLCCLLALKCHLDHIGVSLWHWLQTSLSRASVRGRTTESSCSKLPQPATCVSVLQCLEEEEEEEELNSDAGRRTADEGEKINGITAVLIEKVLNDIHSKTEVVESSSKQETVNGEESVAAAPRGECMQERSCNSQLDPDVQPSEARSSRHDGHRVPSALEDGDDCGGRVARTAGDLGRWDDGAPETTAAAARETPPDTDASGKDGDGGAPPDGCDEPDNTELPLSTSAGVATTPTETQTMAIAGVRGVAHYTLASWLTVEPPHLTAMLPSDPSRTSPPSSHPPQHLPPPPLELLATKVRQQKVSKSFTFRSSPTLPVPGNVGETGSSKRECVGDDKPQRCHQSARHSPTHRGSRPPSPGLQETVKKQRTLQQLSCPGPTQEQLSQRPHTLQQSLHQRPTHQKVTHNKRPASKQPPPVRPVNLGRQQGRPAAGEDADPSTGVWETGVRMANIPREQMVCGACLAALSLPDVHSSHLAQYCTAVRGPGWPPSLDPPVTLNRTPSSLRRQRFAHSGSAEGYGPSDTTDDKWSTFTNKPVDHPSEKPVYQSLERGTKRRPLDAQYGDAERHLYQQLLLDVTNAVGSPSLSESQKTEGKPPITNAANVPRSFPGSVPSTLPGSVPTSLPGSVPRSLPGSVPTSLPGSDRETEPSDGHQNEFSVTRAQAGEASGSPTRIPAPREHNHDCRCRCDGHQRPWSSSGVSEGRDATEGEEHCDIDIETQATQIIDMVELHAQSPCKTS